MAAAIDSNAGAAPLPPASPVDVAALVRAITGAGGSEQRRAMAKAITLLESSRADHRRLGDGLLDALLPRSGQALRVGISGVPGVGKSTFVESLGLRLVALGHRVAVLAVDPSSQLSGGSILGDKTRMERLSVHPQAFIRPSPAGQTLGGVAEKTREAMLVCEAAGHDIVLVETVGVGQSETAVAGMTDCFVLMQLPNAGDELQAIKRGVMELADLVVINKADLDADAATRAQAQISGSLRIVGQHGRGDPSRLDLHWTPLVLPVSALEGRGIDDFWSAVLRFTAHQQRTGAHAERRRAQNEAWMDERIRAGLMQRFQASLAVREALPTLREAVSAGRMAPSVAARRALDLYAAADPPPTP